MNGRNQEIGGLGQVSASAPGSLELSNRVRLERALIRVRWFGAAFALFQIYSGTSLPCPAGSTLADQPVLPGGGSCEALFVRPFGYGLGFALLAINLAAFVWLRTGKGKGIRSLGLTMFLVDHLFLIAYCWMFSNNVNSTAWVMLYILPLEGATRYGLPGSLSSLGLLAVEETLRDIWRQSVWAYPFHFVPDTTFRIGIMAIIGVVGGIMARNLRLQTREVERRADVMQELAQRETEARRELNAIQRAMIAGVSTGDFSEAMNKLVQVIAETLGYQRLCIGIIDGSPSERVLTFVAGFGYPKQMSGISVPLTEGVCGPVASSGKPILISDLADHPDLMLHMPDSRSEMAVPLRVGDHIIGVMNAESTEPGSFGDDDLAKLHRMAVQVAVIIENAKVLAKETEAVGRLTELDVMKSDFIAITSHELRTPLT
ncbi:MAG: GAF domain-containing protein, partial [Actinobacteria bacterium]|nr:GAF domain-containing protein [Actinomycetota bacterium]